MHACGIEWMPQLVDVGGCMESARVHQCKPVRSFLLVCVYVGGRFCSSLISTGTLVDPTSSPTAATAGLLPLPPHPALFFSSNQIAEARTQNREILTLMTRDQALEVRRRQQSADARPPLSVRAAADCRCCFELRSNVKLARSRCLGRPYVERVFPTYLSMHAQSFDLRSCTFGVCLSFFVHACCCFFVLSACLQVACVVCLRI